MDNQTAYYLYCLARSAVELKLADEGVFLWSANEMSAVIGEVRRDEFCGPDAEARLQDLTWLAPRACRHEIVIEHVMSQAPVLPARFATLFRSLGSLDRFLLDHRQSILNFFEQLGDKREWAVKGLLNRLVADQSVSCERSVLSPGRDYLEKKRGDNELRQKRSRRLDLVYQEAARKLQAHASGFRERKVWKASDSETPVEAIVNWAFLVPNSAEPGFHECIEQLGTAHRATGVSFVLTGPWPPYSFAPALGVPIEAGR